MAKHWNQSASTGVGRAKENYALFRLSAKKDNMSRKSGDYLLTVLIQEIQVQRLDFFQGGGYFF